MIRRSSSNSLTGSRAEFDIAEPSQARHDRSKPRLGTLKAGPPLCVVKYSICSRANSQQFINIQTGVSVTFPPLTLSNRSR